MNELVTVRNTANGGVTQLRRNIAEHPVFGKHLEIVPAGTKPTVPLTEVVKEARRTRLAAPVVEDSEYDLEKSEEGE